MTTLRRRELTVAVLLYLAVFAALSLTILSKHLPGDGYDYWVHLAAIRALAEGSTPAHLPLGSDPVLLQRHYDPSHVVWALVLRHTSLTGTDVMALAGIVYIAVFLSGLAFLASRFRPPALTASCFLVVMLFMWGMGYGWSNEYYFSILPQVAAYPSTLAWGLSLFAFGLIETWSRRGGVLRLAGATLLGLAAAAIHPLTALMFTLTFPVLWVWLSPTTWRRRWAVLVYPGVALALSLLWGHTNALQQLHSIMGNGEMHFGVMRSTAERFFSPGRALQALGPAPAGMVFLLCVQRRLRLPLAAGMAVCAVAALGGALAGVPMAHRFIFFLVFVLHMTAALGLQHGWRLWRHRRRLAPERKWSTARVPAALAAVAMLLFPWVPLHVWRTALQAASRVDVSTLRLRPSPLVQLEESCTQLRSTLPPDGRVLTDRGMVAELAAFGVPIVPMGGLRGGPPATVGAAFVQRVAGRVPGTGATHLLIRWKKLEPRERRTLSALGTVTTMPPDLVVVRLKESVRQGGGGPSGGGS